MGAAELYDVAERPALARAAAAGPRFLYWFVARRTVEGAEHLPRTGGCVIAPNHVTELDPVTVALSVLDQGLTPHFLAKESLFRIPVAGRILHAVGQVPVHRGSTDTVKALAAAQQALAAGMNVVVYPEGTLTRDPDKWPMTSYPGAARLALSMDVPLIPMAHWGDHRIVGRDADWKVTLDLLPPRKPVAVRFGPPVDLSAWAPDPEQLTGRTPAERLEAVPHASAVAATTAVVDAIARELAVLRGEPVPARRWDRRRGGLQ